MAFDLAEVRRITENLNDRMAQCDNGEGMECASLDDALRHHAKLCCEFYENVRSWGRAVFAGSVTFDPEVEQVWLSEGHRLYMRAYEMSTLGQHAEVPCFMLDGQHILDSAIWNLYQLLAQWVSPTLAIGPAARQELELSPSKALEIKTRIESLPSLPFDWQPKNVRQQGRYKKLRK